jgi:hypothetical protein
MLVNVSYAKIIEAFCVALDFLSWRNVVIFGRAAGVGGWKIKDKKKEKN